MIALQLIFLALLLPVCLIGPGSSSSAGSEQTLEKLSAPSLSIIISTSRPSASIWRTSAPRGSTGLRSMPALAALRAGRSCSAAPPAGAPGADRLRRAAGVAGGMAGDVRSYSGGDWGADWYEHYERALFFRHFDTSTVFTMDQFPIPAVAAVHLVCGHFMAQAGKDYAFFQVTCSA